jgi:hypothetical protein
MLGFAIIIIIASRTAKSRPSPNGCRLTPAVLTWLSHFVAVGLLFFCCLSKAKHETKHLFLFLD